MSTPFHLQVKTIEDHWGSPVLCVNLKESFDEVLAQNPALRIEQLASGEILMMNPTGGEGGVRNARLVFQLQLWAENNSGFVFDSSTLFRLPGGSKRSPDAAWIAVERWHSLSKDDRQRFPPICPDFVVELRSETDQLSDLISKMVEYIENGVSLGWLIDPLLKRLHVYRPDQPAQVLDNPATVAADPQLPGFVLDLNKIWNDI